jgi:hypothetical protein
MKSEAREAHESAKKPSKGKYLLRNAQASASVLNFIEKDSLSAIHACVHLNMIKVKQCAFHH